MAGPGDASVDFAAIRRDELVTVDVGGTHVRFAIATLAGDQVQALDHLETLKTAEHGSFQLAWEAYAARIDRPLPAAAAIAFAGPVGGQTLKLTNNPWIIRPALIPEKLGVERHLLINDFGAIGHAVARVGEEHLAHVCGPETALPENGMISIIGPGTGLGVAQLLRRGRADYDVIETEGGHSDFAPLDPIEDALLRHLRESHRRVSIERIVSGPGLANLYEALGAIEGRALPRMEEKALWAAAIAGEDSLAAAALDRFCLSLGAVAGDIALTQGSSAVVIAGGVGQRIAHLIGRSGFAERFVAKGRFEAMMAAIPVKLITHPQPGLYGAAAAFAAKFAMSPDKRTA